MFGQTDFCLISFAALRSYNLLVQVIFTSSLSDHHYQANYINQVVIIKQNRPCDAVLNLQKLKFFVQFE